MKKRKFGAELELFLSCKGKPVSPEHWHSIARNAGAAGCKVIRDTYTDFALGFLHTNGSVSLDNNTATVEMAALPAKSLDGVVENLTKLMDFFGTVSPETELNWTSQASEPKEEEYWNRAVSNGLYPVVRQMNWKHWVMMNSYAFQPAIDVYPHEIVHVLRVLFLTAPVFIWAFEGNKQWGEQHSPRLSFWKKMVPAGENRTGIPRKEIKSLADYLKALVDMPAFVMSDAYKKGTLLFFEGRSNRPRVKDVLFNEVPAKGISRIINAPDPRQTRLVVKDIRIRAGIRDFYMLSLPLWYARLVFTPSHNGYVHTTKQIEKAIEGAEKRYVEIRHVGTPKNMRDLITIFQAFVRLVDNAAELDEKISSLISWQGAKKENDLAVAHGMLGENSRKVRKILMASGILNGKLY